MTYTTAMEFAENLCKGAIPQLSLEDSDSIRDAMEQYDRKKIDIDSAVRKVAEIIDSYAAQNIIHPVADLIRDIPSNNPVLFILTVGEGYQFQFHIPQTTYGRLEFALLGGAERNIERTGLYITPVEYQEKICDDALLWGCATAKQSRVHPVTEALANEGKIELPKEPMPDPVRKYRDDMRECDKKIEKILSKDSDDLGLVLEQTIPIHKGILFDENLYPEEREMLLLEVEHLRDVSGDAFSTGAYSEFRD